MGSLRLAATTAAGAGLLVPPAELLRAASVLVPPAELLRAASVTNFAAARRIVWFLVSYGTLALQANSSATILARTADFHWSILKRERALVLRVASSATVQQKGQL